MAVTPDAPSPYAPYSVIMSIIGRHRNRGLPSPIDSDVLARAGVSDSLIPRTLQALQTLDLIDETGNPTETFEGIRTAPEPEYQQRLEEWLKSAYADIFSFIDPSEDDEIAVRDAFRNYQPIGQQSRMVSLFLGLCGAAGLAPEKPLQQRAQSRSRITGPQPVRRTANRLPTRSQKNVTSGSIPAALSGLLASLPAEGEGWSRERRESFVTTFESVLDFCFPIVENRPDDPSEDEDGG